MSKDEWKRQTSSLSASVRSGQSTAPAKRTVTSSVQVISSSFDSNKSTSRDSVHEAIDAVLSSQEFRDQQSEKYAQYERQRELRQRTQSQRWEQRKRTQRGEQRGERQKRGQYDQEQLASEKHKRQQIDPKQLTHRKGEQRSKLQWQLPNASQQQPTKRQTKQPQGRQPYRSTRESGERPVSQFAQYLNNRDEREDAETNERRSLRQTTRDFGTRETSRSARNSDSRETSRSARNTEAQEENWVSWQDDGSRGQERDSRTFRAEAQRPTSRKPRRYAPEEPKKYKPNYSNTFDGKEEFAARVSNVFNEGKERVSSRFSGMFVVGQGEPVAQEMLGRHAAHGFETGSQLSMADKQTRSEEKAQARAEKDQARAAKAREREEAKAQAQAEKAQAKAEKVQAREATRAQKQTRKNAQDAAAASGAAGAQQQAQAWQQPVAEQQPAAAQQQAQAWQQPVAEQQPAAAQQQAGVRRRKSAAAGEVGGAQVASAPATPAANPESASASAGANGGNAPLTPEQQKDEKKRKRSKRLWTVILIISIIALVGAAVAIILIMSDYAKARAEYDDIASNSVSLDVLDNEAEVSTDLDPRSLVDFDSLLEMNEDFVAWIYIPGTNVNYPIIRGETNNEYLRRTFKGEYNDSGTIFLDCDNARDMEDQSNLIYGHSMDDGSMFKDLLKYTDQTYFKKHQTVYIITPDKLYCLKVVGLYRTHGDDATVRKFFFDTDDDFHEYLREKYESCIVADNLDIDSCEQVFSLVTCSYNSNDERTILLCVDDPDNKFNGTEYESEATEESAEADASESSEN